MATNPSYCVHSDVKDVYPQIDEFDTKVAIYGWKQHTATDDQDIWYADNTGYIPNLFRDGQNLTGTAESSLNSITGENEWFYDSQGDRLHLHTGAGGANKNPNDMLIEGGEEWTAHVTDIIRKSSAYLDSRIDANLPRRQFKNSDGEYDYLIIRTTALITASFLIKAHNPMSELLEKFEEEYNFNIELINSGKAKLSYQVSGDASKGVVKEVSVNGALKIVDTRGHYSGVYDRLKVKISTTGVVGTGKYDVYAKDSDSLKADKIVDGEIINGDYQQLAGGLQLRFQGASDSSSATENDEWEIEVFGIQESLDDNIGAVTYTSMTRTSRPFRKGYRY
jgi:hypothetical protein